MKGRRCYFHLLSLAIFCCLWLSFCDQHGVLTGVALAAPAASSNSEELEYYTILGLESKGEDATERDIKSAWRKLSKKHHPDVAGESAREYYQKVQRAYEVLGDRRKRKIYDILGEEGVRSAEQPQQQMHGMQAMFQAFGFGGGTGTTGPNMEMVIVVRLEDLYKGEAHTVSFHKVKICRACRGTGAKSPAHIHTCSACKGRGVIEQVVQLAPGFSTRMDQECPRCQGTGKTITAKCSVCSGKKVVRGITKISVDIEPGTPEGTVIKYELEANQQPKQVPGDVLLTVQSAPHPTFERKGNDLYTTLSITLKEALLGFASSIPHLDGHLVEVSSTNVVQHGQVIKIKGEGMPYHNVPSEKGDLFITYAIKFPSSLTDKQRDTIRRFL